MIARRSRDWFSIVATDLFCGILCAVIILDATTERAITRAAKDSIFTMTYAAVMGDRCGGGDVIFAFDVGGETRYSTEARVPEATMGAGECVVSVFMPSIQEGEGIENPRIIVTAAAEPFTASVHLHPLGSFECQSSSGKCESKQ